MCQKEEDMSSYSEWQVHQLVDKLEAEGFTAEHITKLGQYANLGDIRLVLDGRAKIVILPVEKPAQVAVIDNIIRVAIWPSSACLPMATTCCRRGF
jgi:hypothetical protein